MVLGSPAFLVRHRLRARPRGRVHQSFTRRHRARGDSTGASDGAGWRSAVPIRPTARRSHLRVHERTWTNHGAATAPTDGATGARPAPWRRRTRPARRHRLASAGATL